MTEEALAKAVKLSDKIKEAKKEVEVLNGIPFDSPKRLLIEGGNISLCKELTEKVIRLLVDYKQECIAEWQKELDEL